MEKIKIGNFISECRKEKKLTQEQLAEKMDVSVNAVSKWERGLNLPDLEIEYGNKRKTIKLEEISKPEESFEQKVENARKIAETKLKEYDKGTVYVVKEENKQSFNQILNSYRI